MRQVTNGLPRYKWEIDSRNRLFLSRLRVLCQTLFHVEQRSWSAGHEFSLVTNVPRGTVVVQVEIEGWCAVFIFAQEHLF